jgi:hypothetical protein
MKLQTLSAIKQKHITCHSVTNSTPVERETKTTGRNNWTKTGKQRQKIGLQISEILVGEMNIPAFGVSEKIRN